MTRSWRWLRDYVACCLLTLLLLRECVAFRNPLCSVGGRPLTLHTAVLDGSLQGQQMPYPVLRRPVGRVVEALLPDWSLRRRPQRCLRLGVDRSFVLRQHLVHAVHGVRFGEAAVAVGIDVLRLHRMVQREKVRPHGVEQSRSARPSWFQWLAHWNLRNAVGIV